mgnify:CR=1 FL=1
MAARKTEARLNIIVGSFVLIMGFLGVMSIFVIGQGKGAWKEKVTIAADFRQVSGLKKGSPVQLEGIEIGVVKGQQFVTIDYPCDPETEDRGRRDEIDVRRPVGGEQLEFVTTQQHQGANFTGSQRMYSGTVTMRSERALIGRAPPSGWYEATT